MQPPGDDHEDGGLMRSLLFVPGDSDRKLEKGLVSGADVLIVDLEDSIAPQDKQRARDTAATFLNGRSRESGMRFYVRVNDLASGLTDDDLKAIVAPGPDGIILPKCNSGADLQHLSAKLRLHEAEAGLPDGGIAILSIITETSLGVLSGSTYAGASPRLAGLTWGAEDLSAALGARSTRDDAGNYTDVFRFARTVTLLASSAAEVAAIDTVFVNFRDADALKRECLEAERDGFTGKLAIHPAQVPIINEAFTPSERSVEQARGIVAAFEAAGNPGVVSIDGQMYDVPHLKRALRLLARAEQPNA